MSSVKKLTQTLKERQSASITCTFAVQEVVRVHTDGIRQSLIHANGKATHAPDRTTKFTARMTLLIKAVRDSKIVAIEGRQAGQDCASSEGLATPQAGQLRGQQLEERVHPEGQGAEQGS